MSVCANIFVLFRVTPTTERVREIEAKLVELLGHRPWASNRWNNDNDRFLTPYGDTDMLDFTQEGQITTRLHSRTGLPGPVDESRFYEISYLSRWWSETNPDGPMDEYGATMLYLMEQPDIEHVWFAADEFSKLDQMTPAEVKRMMERHAQQVQDDCDTD